MEVLIIGLGKMGGNMARRWLNAGHRVIGYDRDKTILEKLSKEAGLIPSASLEDAINKMTLPRMVWIMLPSGKPVEDTIQQAVNLLNTGDVVVDGGNSNFNDSIRTGKTLAGKGIHFFDAGVSGGIWGLEEGYSIMVGGDAEAFPIIEPLIKSLAPSDTLGWGLVGPAGAGHFTKMVHNGIEYGMMEAYAEGFELMQSRKDMCIDLEQVSKIWQHSSVVRSWMLDLIMLALEKDQTLSDIQPWVSDSGEGRWTVNEAINQGVPVPVIAASLFRRFESREDNSYAYRLLSAMRGQFGGHTIKNKQVKHV
jgi:6-phosphogluconate dehydrogenase